jgi:hypothetical protein
MEMGFSFSMGVEAKILTKINHVLKTSLVFRTSQV